MTRMKWIVAEKIGQTLSVSVVLKFTNSVVCHCFKILFLSS